MMIDIEWAKRIQELEYKVKELEGELEDRDTRIEEVYWKLVDLEQLVNRYLGPVVAKEVEAAEKKSFDDLVPEEHRVPKLPDVFETFGIIDKGSKK